MGWAGGVVPSGSPEAQLFRVSTGDGARRLGGAVRLKVSTGGGAGRLGGAVRLKISTGGGARRLGETGVWVGDRAEPGVWVGLGWDGRLSLALPGGSCGRCALPPERSGTHGNYPQLVSVPECAFKRDTFPDT